MKYSVKASTSSSKAAEINIKESDIHFGISPETAASTPNPAELFLGSFSACILKNLERFSVMMKFEYSHAEIDVTSTRLEKPPRMDNVHYNLRIFSSDKKLNPVLLKKNIEKFGTIYNTVKLSSEITGEITVIEE
jgi:uncharacterized OsmC-like protein